MFDTLVTKIVKPKSVYWKSPNELYMDLGSDEGVRSYKLLKGAEDYIYKALSIKPATSKEVYKNSDSTWKQLIDIQSDVAKNNVDETKAFYLDKPTIRYLINNNEIVDIIDLIKDDYIEEFEIKHQKFILEITTNTNTKKFFTENKNGLVKLVCYDKKYDIAEEEYTPVVILELNNDKSTYNVCTGILIYKDFTFVPSISYNMCDNHLATFIRYFDMDDYLKYAEDRSKDFYEKYTMFKDNSEEISLREMTNLCKKVGYKLEIDNEANLAPIDNMYDEENNQKIQKFYNSFKEVTGESTYELLKLSDLRKAFRYNKLTLLDVLGVLSKEYLAYSGGKITAELLGDIVYKLINTSCIDRNQAEDVKKDVNS